MMNVIGQLLLGIFSIVILVTGHILIMIFGWGLLPISWGWVIGGLLITGFISALVSMAAGA